MARPGFIHDPLDIKLLVLYVMSRVAVPPDFSTLTALSLQDDGMDYFLFAQAVEELVNSGHLQRSDDGFYSITEKGRSNSAVMENSLPSVVRGRCNRALAQHNDALRREAQVIAQVSTSPEGRCQLALGLSDDEGELFRLTLTVPDEAQGQAVAERFRNSPEQLFHAMLAVLLDAEKDAETDTKGTKEEE